MFVVLKMNDLLKTITVTIDTYLIAIAVVSKPSLDTLPPDLQKVVLDAGPVVQARPQKWHTDSNTQLDQDWIKLGGIIHKLDADQASQLKQLLGPVADNVTKDQPAVHDMLQLVRDTAAKHPTPAQK